MRRRISDLRLPVKLSPSKIVQGFVHVAEAVYLRYNFTEQVRCVLPGDQPPAQQLVLEEGSCSSLCQSQGVELTPKLCGPSGVLCEETFMRCMRSDCFLSLQGRGSLGERTAWYFLHPDRQEGSNSVVCECLDVLLEILAWINPNKLGS